MALNLRLVAVCFSISVIVLLQTVGQTEAGTCCTSHYENYQYSVTVANYQCSPYTYTYCYNWCYYSYWYRGYRWYYRRYYYGWYWNPWYGWGYWNWCHTRTSYNCYYTYTTQLRWGQRCATGWVGSYCNVPTCNPACVGGMICSDLNSCTCAVSGGTNCQIVPCSPTNNCYPGTCVSGVCQCPPGFNGTNCEQIKHTPVITTCGASLTAKATPGAASTQIAQASCAAPGESPIHVWVGGGLNNDAGQNGGYGLDTLEVRWTPSYTYPLMMPNRPTGATSFFVSNAPVPIYIYDASYTLTFPDANNFTTAKVQCALPTGATPTQYDCVVSTQWSKLNINPQLIHNATMIVNMAALLGGTKTGDSTYYYNSQSYSFSNVFLGTPIVYQAAFQFDLVRPTQCLLLNNRNISACTSYPIFLDNDISSDPAIRPVLNGWTDDGSGIAKFTFKVELLGPDNYGRLSPVGSPLVGSETALTADTAGTYYFSVPNPGVYAITVTAYDYAGNTAKARKIFNYINTPSYTIDSTQPVYLQEATPASNYSFIGLLTNPIQLNLVWTGRFKATDQWRTKFAAEVNALTPVDGYTVDDIYGTTFGQRSLAAHPNQTGVSSYIVQWYVDTVNGGINAQPSWADDLNNTKTVTTETTTIELTEPLANGHAVVVWLTASGVTNNNSTFRIVTQVDQTTPNVTAQSFTANGGSDGYYSRFSVTVADKDSGIQSINYTIVDILNNNNVIIPLTSAPASIRPRPSKKRRDLVQPCTASDPTCYCIPIGLCFNYVQNVDIDNCKLDRYSNSQNFHLQIQYQVINLAGVPSFKQPLDLNLPAVQCRPSGGLSGGAIAGIVIGCVIGFLLLLAIIILIIVIVIRIRNNEKPIPSRQDMRTYMHNARNRFTMRGGKSANNEVYAANVSAGAGQSRAPPPYSNNNKAYAADVDEMYVDKEDMDKFKISKKLVQFGDVLNEGRFAVIRRGYYTKANDRQPVAVKALKSGYNQQDELLMTKKVAFMKNVPQHSNLVAFYGFMDENDGQGPIMVLELCDYPLTDWLARLSNVTVDELELMLLFALNIAQGVQHLHNNKIIHRRLAARNVLLKQQVNGLVAKLIGFGPTAEDVTDDSTAGAGVAVPKKWLAPETLDSLNKKSKTVYNEKTDAWSYAVTVWEIYAKGAAPYQEVKSNDIHNLVKRGERLKCPSDCPPELFNNVMKRCWNDKPNQRPSFREIQDWIQGFRSNGPQEAYYAANENEGEMYANSR